MDKYTVDHATHFLQCKHCISDRCRVYYMKCIVLPSKSKLIKVLVFGDRDWANKDHIKRVRYVESWRLHKI